MNQVATLPIQQNREVLVKTLSNSLYVGAKAESIEMAISYCEATGLDIMQKPVHIVPMNTKNPVTNKYEWRDVIMPGIGLYRIQADRAGTMAGISEPVFGDLITHPFPNKDKNGNALPDVEATFPEWCKVSVKKLVGQHIVEFIAKEYWVENYAVVGKGEAPNSMWKKRPRGQLAKCAEAQALRKAFPELGAQPTAEEMEGKVIENVQYTVESASTDDGYYPQEQFENNLPAWTEKIKSGAKTPQQMIDWLCNKKPLSSRQIDTLNSIEVPAQ